MPNVYGGLIKYGLLLMCLCGLCIMPLTAQDDDPYAEALRRIEQALEDEATKLDLMSLSLTTLPPEIGQLSNLQWLDLHNNQLTALPLEMGQLTQLSTLYTDSVLSFPPLEIQQQGIAPMLAYLRDYESMLMRQTIAIIAGGVGGLALLILAFRWRQRRGVSEKKKRA